MRRVGYNLSDRRGNDIILEELKADPVKKK
jgi:hypothetical protein